MKIIKFVAFAALALSLTACSNMRGRDVGTVAGAGVGAAAGSAIGGSGSGAVVGAVGGAVVGGVVGHQVGKSMENNGKTVYYYRGSNGKYYVVKHRYHHGKTYYIRKSDGRYYEARSY